MDFLGEKLTWTPILISMLPFGEEGADGIREVEKEIRGCYQFNTSPFLDPFYSPDTIPLYDPPPTGDGHIYVQFTVTSTNGLVKHVLVSSLSNRRPETH